MAWWVWPLALGASKLVDALLSNKKYPPELEALLKSMSTKANQLMTSPGYSEQEISAIFGTEMANVKGMGKNVDRKRETTLQNIGMAETGTAVKTAQEDAWSNEDLVTKALLGTMVAKKQAQQQDQALAAQMAQTAVGADVNRVEKGPQFTDIVGLMAMMAPEGGQQKDPLKDILTAVNPVQDSYAILANRMGGNALTELGDPFPTTTTIGGGYKGLSWADILGGKSLFGGKKGMLW